MPQLNQIEPNILRAALDGLESQRNNLEEQISEVRRMLGTETHAIVSAKRTVSEEARKRMADAQRKRRRREKKQKTA